MFTSDGKEKRALRSVLNKYATLLQLQPANWEKAGRNVEISPFELTSFLDIPLATHSGVKYKVVSEELSAFTDYSFTLGKGFCSPRSMWSQTYKDRIRTRKCDTDLLVEPESNGTQPVNVLFRKEVHLF